MPALKAVSRVFPRAFAFHRILLLALAFLGCATGNLSADTISLNPVADAYIGSLRPNPGISNLFVGTTGVTGGPEIRRSLLRFDLSNSVPQGAQINSVTLQIDVIKEAANGAVGNVVDARRLLRDWNEDEVTWDSPSAGQSWQAPGADGFQDSAALPSSAIFVTDPSFYVFPSQAGLVADVQAWVDDPASNFGWLLASENESTPKTARVVSSREDPNVADR